MKFFHCGRHLYECLFLDKKNNIVGKTASRNEDQFLDEVIEGAFRHSAFSVVLSHKHPIELPINDNKLQQDDVTLGEIEFIGRLKYLLDTIQVRIYDHIIITDKATSFSELEILI